MAVTAVARSVVWRWLGLAAASVKDRGRLTLFDLLPEGAADLLRSEHYGGAGCAFAHMPHKVKSSRKFIVIYQSGGFDI